jgi:cell division protein FtsB
MSNNAPDYEDNLLFIPTNLQTEEYETQIKQLKERIEQLEQENEKLKQERNENNK